MKPEIAKIWCDALESNEYEQGKAKLCVSGRYCCLGVLCELAIKNGVILKKGVKHFEMLPNGTVYERIAYNDCDMVPPAEVREWAGMKTVAGEFEENEETTSLAYKNDHGASFAELATMIKEKVNEL